MGVLLVCHLHRLPPKCALSHQQASPSRDQMALADPLWAGLPRHQKPLPVMEHIVILEKRQVSMETTGLYSHTITGFKEAFSWLCLGLCWEAAKGALANWAPCLARTSG